MCNKSAAPFAVMGFFAQYIKRRKELKLTQDDLAKRTGMARTNITRFEGGKYNPSLEMMVKIAAALNMSVQVKLESREEQV